MAHNIFNLFIARLFFVAGLFLLLDIFPSLVYADHCPGLPGGGPTGRHSCSTRTQTWQPSEAVDNHPGGARGRGSVQTQGIAASQSVHCQLINNKCVCGSPGYTGRNIPCRPEGQQKASDIKVKPIPVFNYYYINGINTPEQNPEGGRGSYDWDRALIAGNLLGKGPVVNVGKRKQLIQSPQQIQRLVQVDPRERNVFSVRTYNFSGTAPRYAEMCRNPLAPPVVRWLCQLAGDAVDGWRASTPPINMAGGDILECLYQATWDHLNFAATQPEIATWARFIVDQYGLERTQGPRAREKHFFILIGHSQGNFFVEGLAYRLRQYEGTLGREIVQQRLGIVALASPTSYVSLNGLLPGGRLKHLTRHDDAILALRDLSIFLHGKVPFSGNAPALWSYQPGQLDYRLQVIQHQGQFPPIFSPLFEALGLAPLSICEPPTNAECNHALYTPFMNSHLIDNYLTNPTMTQPGKPIHWKVQDWLDRGKMRTARPEVLSRVRANLKTLKAHLLANSQ